MIFLRVYYAPSLILLAKEWDCVLYEIHSKVFDRFSTLLWLYASFLAFSSISYDMSCYILRQQYSIRSNYYDTVGLFFLVWPRMLWSDFLRVNILRVNLEYLYPREGTRTIVFFNASFFGEILIRQVHMYPQKWSKTECCDLPLIKFSRVILPWTWTWHLLIWDC